MPVDYSKWDALELSDDSDFEPHPNVDKKSFIRAKQNQIHMQRAERKHQIETLKYERIINNGLLRRIDTLLAELRGHEADAKDRTAFLFQAMIASAGDPDEDEVPKPPAGVHSKDEQAVKYSQMMGSLVDQAKKEVDASGTEDWYHGYIKAVEGHKKKVTGLQKELETKLAELEKEETRKITSEHIRDGFNSSSVSKEKPRTESDELVEILNPKAVKKGPLGRQDSNISSGAEADVDENLSSLQAKPSESEKISTGDDDENVQATELGKEFAKIKMKDYQASLRFISQNRQILAERETDGLLMLAFDAQLNKDASFAKQCVHQALLIQYCRSLGRDGVQLFFKRIMTPGHQAYKVFMDDVNDTYEKMRSRTVEIAAERASSANEEQVEQIQLQAMEPGTEIHFNIPLPDSEDEIEKQARAVFESFPPGLQRALESGSLDRVNEVLGKMSVEEAEEVVGQLGESGMLDMREGVIDGTTEEGKEELKKMQAEMEKPRVEEILEDGNEDIGEPGDVVVAEPD